MAQGDLKDDLIVELARFIERIAAIGRTGLAFKPDGYDAERYEDLLREAVRIRAVLDRDLTTDAEVANQLKAVVEGGRAARLDLLEARVGKADRPARPRVRRRSRS